MKIKWILLLLVPLLIASSVYLPHRRKAFVSGAFSPSDLTGLRLWYNADSISGSEGAAVTSWADDSGNGDDVSMSVAANQPILRLGVLNGHKAVEWETGDNLTNLHLTSITQSNSMFMVAYNPTNSGTYSVFQTGSPYLLMRWNGAAFEAYAGNYFGGALGATNWYVYSVTINGANSFIYTNGVQRISGNASTGNSGTTLSMGDSLWTDWRGIMAEIICYEPALNTTDRQQVETYLKDKYFPGGYP